MRLVVGDPLPVTSTLRAGMEGAATAATGTVTVTVTNDAGTAVATNAATVAGTGEAAGQYTWTPTAVMLTQPDVWTLDWSDKTGATVNRTWQTFVEVTGARSITPAELRDRWPDQFGGVAAARWPAQTLADAIEAAERRAEQVMLRSVVPRLGRVERTCPGGTRLMLPRPQVRAVRKVTVAGVDVTSAVTLEGAELCPVLVGTWTTGAALVITFEYGPDSPPGLVRDAVATIARDYATRATTAIPDRAERWQPAGQGGFYSLATPGPGRIGLPQVDAILADHTWIAGSLW